MPRNSAVFTTRKAEPRDVEPLVRLQRAAVEKSWKSVIGAGFDAFLAERFNHESQVGKYNERIVASDRFVLVVEADGKLAGFGGARQCTPDEPPSGFGWQASAFYIAPDSEGKGAGRVLMAAILGELKARGGTDMSLWCLAGNDGARRFYEKNGARLIENAPVPDDYAVVAPHVAYGWKI